MAPGRLYFVTRSDLSEGRRAAQLIHAMDLWVARHGPQMGTVIVYEVPLEEDLLLVWDYAESQAPGGVLFREPDLGDEATAFATAYGPMDLPLLGSKRARFPRVAQSGRALAVRGQSHRRTDQEGRDASWVGMKAGGACP